MDEKSHVKTKIVERQMNAWDLIITPAPRHKKSMFQKFILWMRGNR